MAENNQDNAKSVDVVAIIEFIKNAWNYMLKHWLIVVIFGFSGACIGLGLSFILKPDYTSHLSFALVEKSPGTSGLASLASSFGLSGLFGGGASGAFSGDNLLEIIKSRYAVENTLLSPVNFEGKQMTMMDAFVKFSKLHKKWENAKNKELRTIQFPLNLPRDSFSRTQDSVLFATYDTFMKTGKLSVVRKDKKISIVNVKFTSKNEQFSKEFVENLMSTTYEFYKQTKTSQSRSNINMMENIADSIRGLYEKALYGSAMISQVNINTAFQTAAVPKIKNENDALLYGTVYAEVLKNLETLKLDLARETPIVQLIDTPRYPLKKKKFGKLKGLVFGGLTGGVIITVWLLLQMYVRKDY
jgi:hypothetical protein